MIDKSMWKKVKLGDVADEISIRIDNPSDSNYDRFVGLEHFVSGELTIKNWGHTQNLISSMKEFKSGDILMARRNVYLKRASMADFDGVCSGDAIVLREKTDKVVKNFLPLILNTNVFWEFANANADGSMSKRINVKTLLKYEFLLPPIEEQKRMAELLWAADEVVQKNKSSLASLLSIKSVFMNELSKLLVSDGLQTELGEIMDYESGQVDPKITPYRDMPLVAPNHVESGTGRIISVETASEQNAISGKYKFIKGEIVYSKIRPNLNKVFIAPFDGLCSADMYPLKPKVERVSCDFLYYILISAPFLRYATTCSVRTSIPKLNRTDMSKFKLNCPSLDYQLEFVTRMKQIESAINKEEEHIRASLDVLERVKEYFLGGAD